MSDLSLGNSLKEYVLWLKGNRKSEHTCDIYPRVIRNLSRQRGICESDNQLSDGEKMVLAGELVDIASMKNQDGGGYSTQRLNAAVVKSFAKYAGYNKRIDVGLTAMPPQRIRPVIADGDFQSLLNALPQDNFHSKFKYAADKAMFWLMRSAGAEPHELVSLGYAEFIGENNHYETVRLKGRTRRREVSLAPEACDALKSYEASYKRITKNSPPLESGVFLRNIKNNGGLILKGVQRRVEDAKRRAGLECDVTSSAIRNLFIQDHRTDNPESLAKLLGINISSVEIILSNLPN